MARTQNLRIARRQKNNRIPEKVIGEIEKSETICANICYTIELITLPIANYTHTYSPLLMVFIFIKIWIGFYFHKISHNKHQPLTLIIFYAWVITGTKHINGYPRYT